MSRVIRSNRLIVESRGLLEGRAMGMLNRDGMLYYVVGSRRLMSPDALQPKAYCTNPGL